MGGKNNLFECGQDSYKTEQKGVKIVKLWQEVSVKIVSCNFYFNEVCVFVGMLSGLDVKSVLYRHALIHLLHLPPFSPAPSSPPLSLSLLNHWRNFLRMDT